MTADVTLPQGRFSGIRADGVSRFLGIPYAAAPRGADRFRAPRPPERISGVVDATAFGATAPQPPSRWPVFTTLIPDPRFPGTEYLNLNIWTPDPAASLPVFVWIHGGGFVTGAGSTSAFDGTSFAKHGIVTVTINYRLAVDGFLHIPGAAANRGLLDQLAALTWVQENIAHFGGDPGNVTVGGESAGSMSVTTLLSMPASRGLFARAIAESGAGHHVHTPDEAQIVADEIAAELGVPLDMGALADVPEERLFAATNEVIGRVQGGVPPHLAPVRRLVFQPVVDGDVLPVHPLDGIRAGNGAGIDLLAGLNGDEYGLFIAPTGMVDKISDAVLAGSLSRLGLDAAQLIDAYRAEDPSAGAAELFVRIHSDWFVGMPVLRLLEARAAESSERTFGYKFAWRPDTFGGHLGACHTIEIPFVFNTLDDPWGADLRGSNAPQSVADQMHGAWVSFIESGQPGWAEFAAGRVVRQLDVNGATVEYPEAYRALAWEGVL